MPREPKTYILPNGTSFFHLNKVETDIIYGEIFTGGCYDHEAIEYPDDGCYVDIGANIGMFAVYVASRCKRATIHSFEPIPNTFEVLKHNAERIEGHDVRAHNVGVSHESTTAIFSSVPRFAISSTMYPDHSPEEREHEKQFVLKTFEQLKNPILRKSIAMLPRVCRGWLATTVNKIYGKTVDVECQLRSLSDMIDEEHLEQIDLLKIDAECAEVDILSGVRNEHWPRIHQIAIEVHRGKGPLGAVLDILKRQGYQTAVDHNPTYDDYPMVFAYGRE
jgi:FkbM family methyltransferase